VPVDFAAVRTILSVPRASNRKASHSREIVFAFSHSLDQKRPLLSKPHSNTFGESPPATPCL